jgi:hypothetical protein
LISRNASARLARSAEFNPTIGWYAACARNAANRSTASLVSRSAATARPKSAGLGSFSEPTMRSAELATA